MRIPFFGRKKSRRRSYDSGGWLKPETRRAVIGVVLIFFSAIVVLSFFEAAGPTGALLLGLLRQGFGLIAYLLPFLLIAWGIYLVRPSEELVPWLQIVGLMMALVGLLGLFHLVGIAPEDAYQQALDGHGGGLVGFVLSFPLVRAFSVLAAILIFFAALVIGIFLGFNLSPSQVWGWIQSMVPLKRVSDEEQEEGEEEVPAEGGVASALPTFRINKMRITRGPDPQQMQLDQAQQQEDEQKKKIAQQIKSANKAYQPPSLDILHSSVGKPNSGNVNENKNIIQNTLEKFGIPVTMGKVSVGPTVTQYTLRPEEGVKLSRITALQNDLALALAAHPLRIEAPIPNTNLIGIEIPNKDVSLVRLRDLLISKEYRAAQAPLTLAVGKDVSGKVRVAPIEKMPHALIAGATGSGKSIFINTLILSLIYRNSPAVVRMILVDPKRVELSVYNNIPHLLTPVITEADKTVNALKWAAREMDRRYRVLAETGARNLSSYNSNHPDEAMPYIVIVIDELADLMVTHARDVEGMIVRLSQMARAIGIHLILATQRPSVNVITGLIKANIPTRIAFNVASQIDSRTILDGSGAEKLLGSGDMLYLPSDLSKPLRLQGSFVSEEEVHQVVNDLKAKNPQTVEYDEQIVSAAKSGGGSGFSGEDGGDDPLFLEAKRLVMETGKASASLLQRRLRVGYARAARLLDILEEQGVIGVQEGNKPREVLAAHQEGSVAAPHLRMDPVPAPGIQETFAQQGAEFEDDEADQGMTGGDELPEEDNSSLEEESW